MPGYPDRPLGPDRTNEKKMTDEGHDADEKLKSRTPDLYKPTITVSFVLCVRVFLAAGGGRVCGDRGRTDAMQAASSAITLRDGKRVTRSR